MLQIGRSQKWLATSKGDNASESAPHTHTKHEQGAAIYWGSYVPVRRGENDCWCRCAVGKKLPAKQKLQMCLGPVGLGEIYMPIASWWEQHSGQSGAQKAATTRDWKGGCQCGGGDRPTPRPTSSAICATAGRSSV
eukprot:EG_transcript_22526